MDATELLTPAEMAMVDRLTIATGTTGLALMDRAGAAVADVVSRTRPTGAAVLVVAGPGNNGGDGFVAARILAQRGYRVRVGLLGAASALTGDAAAAAARWPGLVLSPDEADPRDADVIVDALFGAGLSRNIDGEAASLVSRINASGRPVVAVDIPSGVDGETGQVRGVAIRATETVTFFRLKPGHLLQPGRNHCGPVRLADIGIGAGVLDTVAPRTWRNGPALWRAALRPPATLGHKYGRGHAVVASGGLEGTGAARLAARAALRAGAGLVTVASPGEALAVHAGALDSVMVRRSEGATGLAALLADRRHSAAVLGPALGVGSTTRDMVAAALAAGCAAVLDADALTSFAGAADRIAALVAGQESRAVVLTPHDGEFQRLFGAHAEINSAASKVTRARLAARLTGAVVVSKGPDTVIAAPDGRAAVNANGVAWLATAGAGDVLAGLIGGLLAQGLDGFAAAGAAVWLHAEAGASVGAGLIADDLPGALPAVLAAYFTAHHPAS